MCSNSVPVSREDLTYTFGKGRLVLLAIILFFSSSSISASLPNTGIVASTVGLGVPLFFFVFGLSRNRIVLRIARGGFKSIFEWQKRFTRLLQVGGSVTIVGAIPTLVVPFLPLWLESFPISLFLIGTTVFLSPNQNYLGLFSSPQIEGKYSIQQFLLERKSGTTDFHLLQNGLRIVEVQLLQYGLYVPRNRLFFGYAYTAFNGGSLDDGIESLGEWLADPESNDPRIVVRQILKGAKKAGELDLNTTPTARDWLVKIPWTDLSAILTLVVTLAAVALAILGFLFHFSLR